MERIVERPGALDVHKASVTACVRTWEGRELTEHIGQGVFQAGFDALKRHHGLRPSIPQDRSVRGANEAQRRSG